MIAEKLFPDLPRVYDLAADSPPDKPKKRETFSHLSNHNFRTPGELRIYGSGFRGLAV